MTATAFAIEPALDRFDDADRVTPIRPHLRLVHGESYGPVVPTDKHASLDASVEVYRRRRFFALVATTVLVLAVAWASGVSLTSFSGATTTGATTTGATTTGAGDAVPVVYVVVPGDSYGAIASGLGAANPVAAAQVLRAANGGGELAVGQRLIVQASDLTELGG